MPRYAYVNGRYVRHNDAAVHIEDRGFQFADGVYEVVACIEGYLADERGHFDRLERSLRELKIAMPVPRRTLSHILREIVRRSRLDDAAIYIQVTRGVWKRDFPFPPPGTRPSLIVTARPFKFATNAARKTGIRVITVPDIRWKRPDIKTTSLLAQALAKQEALDKGVQDAWLVDEKGFVTEGSSNNAWIVNDRGVLVTRPAEGNDILRGVTRTALLALKSVKVEERAFKVTEAYKAREAFTSSATALIMPVVEIDGRKVGDGKPGPVTMRLYEEYMAYVRARKAQVSWKA
jgi:D-alanine transaminase